MIGAAELQEFNDLGNNRLKLHDAINELQQTIVSMVKSKNHSKKEMIDVLNNGEKAILIANFDAYPYLMTLRETLIDAINGKYDKEIALLNI